MGSASIGACGDDSGESLFDGGAGDAQVQDENRLGDGYAADAHQGSFGDFPANPIVDSPDGAPAAPPNSSTLFGPLDAGASAGGPCLVEPEVGSLYPNNWLRPRFHWVAANGENLFELRVHAPNQQNDLVVYTPGTYWTMPKSMWDGLRTHSSDAPLTVSVRGGVYASNTLSSLALGSMGPLGIAPVDAPGSIVYWTTSGGSSLKGFTIGDESVGTELVPNQVQQFSTNCIGCHTSTPDGLFVGLSTVNGWNDAIASIEQGKTGQTPPFLGAAGKAALEHAPRGILSFSAAHWQNGDHVAVTTVDDVTIGWVDLEATSGAAAGDLTRTGDPRGAGTPTWSHDGNTIVYVSTDAITTGRLSVGPADLYSVPYANKQGGAATPVMGASDPNFNEYYPVYAPDDQWLAFDRIGNGMDMYNQPAAEVNVIPASGGTPTRLAANDPPACSGKKSPGVTNSWPKWAPSVGKTNDGRAFYWIVFSSTRDASGRPQLFISPVMVDKQNKVTTYAALYLWNQPAGENNHTPAWDTFKIPPTPPPN